MEQKSRKKMYEYSSAVHSGASRCRRTDCAALSSDSYDGGSGGAGVDDRSETKSTFIIKLLMMMKRCDVIVLVFTAIILAVILPSSVVECAKLETQIKLLLNDEDLLSEQQHPQQHAPPQPFVGDEPHNIGSDNHEHYKLYRSELKRLSYETIHRIMRDEDESTYRRGVDVVPHNYQKRSFNTLHKQHDIVRRSAPHYALQPSNFLNLTKTNRTDFQTYENASIITEIDLSENQLEHVNLTAFPMLKVINLSHNSLTTLPISAKNTLISLNLNGNRISHGVTPTDYYLRELHLSGNEIESLTMLNLSLLNALETLDLSCNRIRTIETSFFPQRMRNLKHLNLAHNRLGSVYRETFYNLLSLSTLLLPHNNITDIDYETFLALPNLQYLDLSYNQLKGESIRALQGIPDLMGLSIAYNPSVGASMQEFVASWSLKELDASGTGLCQIPAALAQSVRTLKLTDNWLKIINCGDLDSYPLLQYLDLSHSRIDDIEDDALGRLEILEVLFLDHNNLLKVPLSLPTSLEHLFLQYNRIMDIQEQAFIGLRNLQTLDLSGNQLLYLPALPLPKLLTLNLQSSGLKGLNQAIVHTLPRLRDLLLDDNPIKCSDLLGIAEWASPCRIVDRVAVGGSSSSSISDDGQQQQQLKQQLPAVAGKIDLKQKFVQMHNFYENFKSSCGSANSMNVAAGIQQEQEMQSEPPACALENDDGKLDAVAAPIEQVRNFNSQMHKNADAHKIVSTKVYAAQENARATAEAGAAAVAATQAQQLSKVNQKKIKQTEAPPLNVRHIKVVQADGNPIASSSSTPTKPLISTTTPITIGAKATSIMPTKSSTFNTTNNDNNIIASKFISALRGQPTSGAGDGVDGSGVPFGLENELQHDETTQKLRQVVAFDTTQPTKNEMAASMETLVPPMAPAVWLLTQQQITEMPTSKNETPTPQPTTTTTTATKPKAAIAIVPTTTTTTVHVTTATTIKTDANQDEPETKQTTQTIAKEATISGIAAAATTTTTAAAAEQSEMNETKTFVPQATTTATTTTTSNAKKVAINFKVTEPKTLQPHMTEQATTTTQLQARKEMKMKMMPSMSSLRKSAVSGKFENASAATSTATDTAASSSSSSATQQQITEVPTTATTAAATIASARTIDYDSKTIHTMQQTITDATTTSSSIYSHKSILLSQKQQHTTTDGSTDETTNKSIITTTESTSTTAFEEVRGLNVKKLMGEYHYDGIRSSTSASKDDGGDERNYAKDVAHRQSNVLTSTMVSVILPHRHEPLQVLPKDRHLIGTPILMHRGQNMLLQTKSSLAKAPQILSLAANGNDNNTSSSTTTATTTTTQHHITPPMATSQEKDMNVKWLLNNDANNNNNNKIATDNQQHRRMTLAHTAEEIKTGHVPQSQSTPTATSLAADKKSVTTSMATVTPTATTTATAAIMTTEHTPKWLASGGGKNAKQSKPAHEDKRKLSLTMKKMTFTTTKHATEAPTQPKYPHHTNAARENEAAISRSVQSRLYTELKPSALNSESAQMKTAMTQLHSASKHSTVNTPTLGHSSHELLSFAEEQQHEQLLQVLHDERSANEHQKHARLDSREEEMALEQHPQRQEEPRTSSSTTKHGHEQNGSDGGSKAAQWLDTRKTTKTGHPGLVILLSSSLFVVLLLGLMHVYRCDMPWRRHLPQPRPHQRHFNDDDAHSFLNYQSSMPAVPSMGGSQQQQQQFGMQKWHHSTRAQPPYGSPLHNLHVRELQQTSAVDERINRERKYYSRAISYTKTAGHRATSYSGSEASSSRSNSSQSSATSIGGDDAFYAETTPDSGQTAEALHSDFLPMELLNVSTRHNSSNSESALMTRTNATDTPADNTSIATATTTVAQQQNPNATTANDGDVAADNNRKLSNAKLTQSTRKFGIW